MYDTTSQFSIAHLIYVLQAVIEVVFSFLVVLAAQIWPLEFTPIRISADSKMSKSWAEVTSRADFNTYTHQGSKFFKRGTKSHLN